MIVDFVFFCCGKKIKTKIDWHVFERKNIFSRQLVFDSRLIRWCVGRTKIACRVAKTKTMFFLFVSSYSEQYSYNVKCVNNIKYKSSLSLSLSADFHRRSTLNRCHTYMMCVWCVFSILPRCAAVLRRTFYYIFFSLIFLVLFSNLFMHIRLIEFFSFVLTDWVWHNARDVFEPY